MSEAESGPAPIIVTALMGAEDFAWANALRQRHFPPERNYLDAHITLFHHLPPACEREIALALAQLAAEYPPPGARLSAVMHLGKGVAYRIESPELLAMRDDLAERFRGLLTPQDQARPRMHVTVQNKVTPRESKALHAELSATFEPRPFGIAGLGSFYYRGGPWEAIGRHIFRGR
jgi:hypothetical protein